jgi:hypothetical protein
MKQITVVAEDRVGLLADISYILGKAKINIESLSAEKLGNKCVMVILVKNDARASELLKKNGYEVLESETFLVRLKDEPGAIAELTAALQKAKLNLLSMHYVSRDGITVLIALTVDKPHKAKKELAPFLSFK